MEGKRFWRANDSGGGETEPTDQTVYNSQGGETLSNSWGGETEGKRKNCGGETILAGRGNETKHDDIRIRQFDVGN